MSWWTAVDESFSDVNNIKCSGLMLTIDGWSHLPNSEIAGIDGWGTLIVFAPEDTDKGYQANANVLQIWYGMNSGDRLFIRKYRSSNSGWSRWQEMFKSNSVIPVANGGTGATTADAARENLLAQRKVENVTYLELGASRSSAGNAYIDFHSNKGTDYDARIIVDSNKILQLQSSAGVIVSDMNNGNSGYVRNIQYSTTDLTAGSSALTNGRIYLVYE